MYIENDEFGEWMQKLYAKLEELCKDVRVLRNADRVLPEDDNLLDNQDLCLLFKVSIKTLQRYGQTDASGYGLIDNLTFTLGGNQLNRVDDAAAASAYGGGFEFKDGVKLANEYTYDSNGNLTKDLNKGISTIT